ncbi:MAG TPA: sensor histidine kinase, partial [Kofleriaceae bacterium]|nr:sensor histidine kinase [Kofleriaceae bacterium]
QPRIFDRYVRVGPARERVRGVGLGLFGVRRIVEAHGGRIDVESTPGQGSRFAVQLGTRSPIATL